MDSPICQNIVDKLNNYTIVIENQHGKIIANDLNFFKTLKKEDFTNTNNIYAPDIEYKITIYSKDNTTLGDISIKLKDMNKMVIKNGEKKNIKHLVLYIGLVESFFKGIGKSLIYLVTCKADELNLPIALMAMPSIKDKFSPGTPESVIREKEEKLLQYYNSLGFNRSGTEHYYETYGLIQHYESQPHNVLIRAAANAEQNEFVRRTPANWARLKEEQGIIRGARGGSRHKLTRKNRVRRRRITRK